jgi:hypothetical protein
MKRADRLMAALQAVLQHCVAGTRMPARDVLGQRCGMDSNAVAGALSELVSAGRISKEKLVMAGESIKRWTIVEGPAKGKMLIEPSGHCSDPEQPMVPKLCLSLSRANGTKLGEMILPGDVFESLQMMAQGHGRTWQAELLHRLEIIVEPDDGRGDM